MEDSAPAADEAAPMKKAPETVVMTPVEEDDAKVSMELQTNTPAPERFTKGWWHDLFIGDYDYTFLCTPVWPYPWMCGKKGNEGRSPPTFFGTEEKLPILPSMIMGLQHMFAMVGGLITPSTIMGNLTPNYDTRRYLINASLIVCGIMTIIQSYGIKHPRLPFQLGAGVLSCMGVSFTSLPIGQVVIPELRKDWYTNNPQCTPAMQAANCGISAACPRFPSDIPSCQAQCSAQAYQCQSDSFDHAWGQMVGTSCFCALVPFFLSLLTYKRINQLFPPIVVGPTIMLIGIALINAGIGYWGGGVFCADNSIYGDAAKYGGPLRNAYAVSTSKLASLRFSKLNISALTLNETDGTYSGTLLTPGGNLPGGGAAVMTPNTPYKFMCGNTGDVKDVYGSAQFVGLGFVTFFTIMFVEIFGSPFLRNCSAVIGLLFGYAAAAWSRHGHLKFVPTTIMDQAPGGFFLWVKKPFFPLGFYPPLIIPLFIIYTITSLETWGDTAATIEASRLPCDGNPIQIMRQKGALLNDAVSGIFSGLAGTLPLTTFAQNNGIISLTAVASRRAGIACGCWLLILGILGKVGAWVISIPDPVLGGMTTFLFANVLCSGMRILTHEGAGLNRRTRFIAAASFGLGIGVILRPEWATNNLWPLDAHMKDGSSNGRGKKGIRDAIILILSTGFCFGAVIAFILNALIPTDTDAPEHTVHMHKYSRPEKSAEQLDTANGAYGPDDEEKATAKV